MGPPPASEEPTAMHAPHKDGSRYPNAAEARQAALWRAVEGGGQAAGAYLAAWEPREEAAAGKATGLTPPPRRSGITRVRRAVGAPLLWLGQRLQGTPRHTTTSSVASIPGR
jgi:hypothetical protein